MPMRCFKIFCLSLIVLVCSSQNSFSENRYTIKNEQLQLDVSESGKLLLLKNLQTKQDYAGNGFVWRLYYDTPMAKEIEVLASEQAADPQQLTVSQNAQSITFRYKKLKVQGRWINVQAEFKIALEAGLIRFSSKLINDEPHTILRELHYPLVADCRIPDEYRLLITHTGGQVYSKPKEVILNNSNVSPYKSPAQLFRQMDVKYPTQIAANCFAFFGKSDGLYFGSHDASFQDTWHGLRLYPDARGVFNRLEAGMYKYPNCFSGETWTNDANVIAPYAGTWHVTSKIYRAWANTWWEHRDAPMWVKKMKSWQRIIFRHQYGETLFKYTDLPGRIKNVGESVGADAVFPFGWWNTGMDNGNPHYTTDPNQGGDEGWKKAIAEYKKGGGKILLYFNGKLIDRESEFYKSGKGKEICYLDNTGAEYIEQYKFTGQGTFTGNYNSRSFVVADTRNPEWRKMLLEWADRAYDYGANSVFYDQLGYGERVTNWDRSREFPVPNLRVAADKAAILKIIRDHNAAKDPEFALGTEWLTDATAQYVDYVHIYSTTAGPNSFMDWFRYTFPEIIISDREVRDDTDIERRVNNALLKGLRNDIEIYRCRDLIDKTPNYQRYLAKVNAIKEKYNTLLLVGSYRDVEGFKNPNEKVEARAYTHENGMAIVATQTGPGIQKTVLEVPGYRFKEASTLGKATVNSGAAGQQISLGQYDLAVLIYEKK